MGAVRKMGFTPLRYTLGPLLDGTQAGSCATSLLRLSRKFAPEEVSTWHMYHPLRGC